MAAADFDGDGKTDLVEIASAKDRTSSGYANVMLNTAGRSAATFNSASFAKGQPLAAESIASVFGTHLATKTEIATSAGTGLGGSTATWFDANGVEAAAELFFASPKQLNLEIPSGLANGPATLVIRSGDGVVSVSNVTLADTAPGVYTVDGNLAAANVVTSDAAGNVTFGNAAQTDPSNPNRLIPAPINLDPPSGSVYLILYGTGIRHANPGDVSVQIGNVTLQPAYAGAQGGYAGLDQVNVLLPYALKGSGDTAVTVSVAGQAANTVHVTFE
jgi:uncharacterized protein (TIGR03437 family)